MIQNKIRLLKKITVLEFLMTAFVLGALALVFAQSWNLFSIQIMLSIEEQDKTNGIVHTKLYYQGIYMAVVTAAVLTVGMLVFYLIR